MRISDWSSDVCSSDLLALCLSSSATPAGSSSSPPAAASSAGVASAGSGYAPRSSRKRASRQLPAAQATPSGVRDRKGVGEGKRVSVRVDLGGRRYIKKKNR